VVAAGGLSVSNLEPAPFFLTSAVVAKLAGDRPAFGKGIAHLPVEGKLVDRPRPSAEDPTRPSTWSDPRVAPANEPDDDYPTCPIEERVDG